MVVVEAEKHHIDQLLIRGLRAQGSTLLDRSNPEHLLTHHIVVGRRSLHGSETILAHGKCVDPRATTHQ